MSDSLRPSPGFGGKSSTADQVWRRFGKVENYVEPFFGSGAVLLASPYIPKVESINDKNRFVVNFWRSIQAHPELVAYHADWPVNEADLEARHYWLVTEGAARLNELTGDPMAYDAQIAGWWVWGACSWIGSGWCSGEGPWRWTGDGWDKGDAGQGIKRQLPHLGNAGQGIRRQLPHLGDAGQGINRKLPHLGNAGQGINRWFDRLAKRLRNVRVACGDWSRVCGPSVTWRHGLTAVFLDPPYSAKDRVEVYAEDCFQIAAEVREWALENGNRPDMRIALCGYENEHRMPASWSAWRWKTKGGYGSQGEGQGRDNSARECIWFSPHCVPANQVSLFDAG